MQKIKPNKSKNKAVIYARYSSHSQREVSIEQQVQKCKEYADRIGLDVIAIYSDAALSGKTDDRPKFQQMMSDSQEGKFQYVVAWKSNRMGRNMLNAMVHEEELRDYGVRCVYVEEDFDDTAAGRFALRNMMNVNQFYSENMAEDIMRGLLDNASKCIANTRPPIGYKKGDDKRYAIDEPAAAIVREIFQKVIDGWRYADIAADLNRRKIKTRNGGEWNKGSFHRMINNEMYTGVYKYSDVRIEGGVPAIVSKETFDEAQRVIHTKGNPVGRTRMYSDYILTGKLFCGHCGTMMVGISGKTRDGVPGYHYYTCQKRRLEHACDKKNVSREWIEKTVVNAVREYVMQDNVVEWIIEGYQKFIESARKESALESMKAELTTVKKSTENIMKAIEAGIITETTKERLLELESKRKDLEHSIDIESKVLKEVSPEQIRFWIEQFRYGDIESRDFQKELIRVFVQSIYLYDDKLKLVFNYDTEGERQISFEEIESADSEGVVGSYKLPTAPPLKTSLLSTMIKVRFLQYFMQNWLKSSKIRVYQGFEAVRQTASKPFFVFRAEKQL